MSLCSFLEARGPPTISAHGDSGADRLTSGRSLSYQTGTFFLFPYVYQLMKLGISVVWFYLLCSHFDISFECNDDGSIDLTRELR